MAVAAMWRDNEVSN